MPVLVQNHGRPYILVDTQLSAKITSFLVGGLVVVVSRIGHPAYLTSTALSSKCGLHEISYIWTRCGYVYPICRVCFSERDTAPRYTFF